MGIRVQPTQSIATVKAGTQKVLALDMDVEQFYLVREKNDELMEDDKTLEEYGIEEEEAFVRVQVRGSGGAKRMRVEEIPLQTSELQPREDDLPEVKHMFTINDMKIDMKHNKHIAHDITTNAPPYIVKSVLVHNAYKVSAIVTPAVIPAAQITLADV
jgi:hypothetical protein